MRESNFFFYFSITHFCGSGVEEEEGDNNGRFRDSWHAKIKCRDTKLLVPLWKEKEVSNDAAKGKKKNAGAAIPPVYYTISRQRNLYLLMILLLLSDIHFFTVFFFKPTIWNWNESGKSELCFFSFNLLLNRFSSCFVSLKKNFVNEWTILQSSFFVRIQNGC